MNIHLQPSKPEDQAFVRRLNELAYEDVVVAQLGSWDPLKQKAFFDLEWRTHRDSIIVADGVPVGAVSTVRSDRALTLLERSGAPGAPERRHRDACDPAVAGRGEPRASALAPACVALEQGEASVKAAGIPHVRDDRYALPDEVGGRRIEMTANTGESFFRPGDGQRPLITGATQMAFSPDGRHLFLPTGSERTVSAF